MYVDLYDYFQPALDMTNLSSRYVQTWNVFTTYWHPCIMSQFDGSEWNSGIFFANHTT